MSKNMKFSDFSVGDYIHFTKTFTEKDFESFSQLSGDSNSMHHDSNYAKTTNIGKPIVPIHMVASPMSAIAGMRLPGHPSLYLNHQLHASQPVHYNEEVSYSAKISSINSAQRILNLSIIAYCGTSVRMRAYMSVQATCSEWKESSNFAPLCRPNKAVLITGASGGVGSAVAKQLARHGFNLVLHYNSNLEKAKKIQHECISFGCEAELVQGDLGDQASVVTMLKKIKSLNPTILVHTASPLVDASLDALVAVNYESMKAMTDFILPHSLQQQMGQIVFVGSSAMNYFPEHWENYIGAKTMAASLVNGIHKNYSPFGIQGCTISPGYISTAFSENFRPKNASSLLPEEVAEEICKQIENPCGGNYILQDTNGTQRGELKFSRFQQKSQDSLNLNSTTKESSATISRDDALPSLSNLVRRQFNISTNSVLNDASINATPNWDSLGHLELIVSIEEKYGVKFDSMEIEKTKSFPELKSLLKSKLNTVHI